MGTTMQLPAHPNLGAQLSEAQREATRLREAVLILESRFKQAVTEERFDDATALKPQIQPAHAEAVMAEAHARALAEVLGQVQRERDARDHAEQLERVKAQAQEHYDRAREAERAGMDEIHRLWAEAEAGLAAVRETLRQGVAYEGAVLQARTEVHSALVTLGQREQGTRIAGPNFISAKIAASSTLDTIYRGLTL
jgi:hypothetical protein